MATGKQIPCGPCSVDDVTKNAWRWCTSCEEGLCEDCENVHRRSKASRNHQVISIEDYSKIENVSISQVCGHHGENLEWFCKIHDEVLCVACVPSKHKACSDVVPISESSANSRQSALLFNLEETIEGTLQNVTLCIKNRESATKEFEKQEMAVKTMVLQTRTKINVHLDKLQEKLLYELRSTSQTCKSKYMKILHKLKSTEEMLNKLRDETKHIKQFSSDIQVFLGTRQINERIKQEVESIKNEIGAAKDYELKVSIHSLIEKVSNEVKDFGKIMVSESCANLDFRDPKFDQAQIDINVPTSRNISNINMIKLQLIKSFQMTSEHKLNITDCVILPNGHLLMTNHTKESILIEYSYAGDHIRDIPVVSAPSGIAVIDQDHIVVSYGDSLFLEIMNYINCNVEKKICVESSCIGVSHEDGRIYVLYDDRIHIMDLSGKPLETIKIESKGLSCIKVSKNKIFYADYKTNKVSCRLKGKDLWHFESDSIKFPYHTTIDSYQNAYVVGYKSNSLTIIQHDGKTSRTLLTESDGLMNPQAVYYDNDKRTLMICNEGGKVALYKVV